jgi:aspartate carbamoyltransferase regulatory subunit
MKELKISAIREGTVIDHIPAKNTFKVAEILGLAKHENVTSIATNLQSKKMKLKGIVKVGGRELTEDEVNKVALLAPEATVSIIKEYTVKRKFPLKTPDKVYGIIKCSNPKCITNADEVKTRFSIIHKKPLEARCDYCERVMKEDELILL